MKRRNPGQHGRQGHLSRFRKDVTIANLWEIDFQISDTIFAVRIVARRMVLSKPVTSRWVELGLIFDENPPEAVADAAAQRAELMLDAIPAPAGRFPVVLSSSAGGTMIHEAVGHGLESDLAGKMLSVYSGKIGQKVASDLITVLDDSTLPGRRGSFTFDDEGTPSQRTVLVENGILVNFMYDRLSALKEGRQSTGNGRRESYRHKPYTLLIPPSRRAPIIPMKSFRLLTGCSLDGRRAGQHR
jgi:TldD protein